MCVFYTTENNYHNDLWTPVHVIKLHDVSNLPFTV